MWFDTHCHIYEPPEDQGALARALDDVIAGIVVLGTEPESSRLALQAAGRDRVWAGAAFHPSEVKGFEPPWMEPIEELIDREEVVAVGETGIDLYWDTSYLEDQIAAFEGHIGLSKRSDKALVIHTRNSVDEALEVLERVGPPERLVFHCWSGTEDHLTRALALGAYISFAGNVTFKRSDDLRALCALVPGDRLLVETDSPYLTPEPHRGQTNEPAHVAHVGRVVAAARGEDPEAVAALTTENALTLFGIGQ